MAKFNFNLRDKNCPNETPIYLVIRWNNKRLVFPTNLSIKPKYWNFSKKRAVESEAFSLAADFNTDLANVEGKARKCFTNWRNANDQRQPSIIELREALKEVFSSEPEHKPETAKITFFHFFEQFIKEAVNKVNERSGKPFAASTIQAYGNTKGLLYEFQQKKKKPVDFENIDLDFYIDFTEYLTRVKRFRVNTIGKHIKIIKTVLNEATERGLNEKTSFRSKRFRVIQEPTESIYLNETELQEIYELDLSGNKKLERVRDLFIVGCWTGLRFSDFSQIRPENINGNMIEIETQKTREKVVIPIHETVQEIMKKYDGETSNSLPRSLSNQKMNQYLKQIGEKTDCLKQTISHKTTKAGTVITKNCEKWELLTTHTGRRSFSTNLYLDGVPAITIMKITGHKTEKAFLRYIKITPDENAKILQVHWQKKQGLKVG